jgi:hypothetical protein
MKCKFEPSKEFQTQLDHLVVLAKHPGWRAQAWHRAKILDAEPLGLYKGIAAALTLAMAGQDGKKASEPLGQEKPR